MKINTFYKDFPHIICDLYSIFELKIASQSKREHY